MRCSILHSSHLNKLYIRNGGIEPMSIMSDTFLEIAIDKIHTQQICDEAMIKNLKENVLDEPDGESQFVIVKPSRLGYVDRMGDYLKRTRAAINTLNVKCIDRYRDAVDKINPIGLEVPKVDTTDDNEIKDFYKNMRVVIHDKFGECAMNENGEGFIKFIDTLATPEERAENYKIPEFNSVYHQFIKDKKVDKVSKQDLAKAIKTISDYDCSMGQIIADADKYCEERDKNCYLFNDKNMAFSLKESAEQLSRAMLIVETDYLQAEELEMRSKALLESVKTAHIILSGLCAHNPRDIKESSLRRSVNIPIIEDYINDVIINPDSYLREVSVQGAGIEKAIDSFRVKAIASNKKFLSKYEELASKSSCAGLSMEKWYIPIDLDKRFNAAIAIINNTLDFNRLKTQDVEYLSSLYSSTKAMEKAIMFEKTSRKKENITSPALKKVVELLSFIDKEDKKWFVTTKDNYKVTKKDVKDSISFLKDTEYNLKILKKEVYDTSIDTTNVYNGGRITPSVSVSKKERLLNGFRKIKGRILSWLSYTRAQSKLSQFKVIQAQSRKVITLAARVVNEGAIAEEKNELHLFLECYSQLEGQLLRFIDPHNLDEDME